MFYRRVFVLAMVFNLAMVPTSVIAKPSSSAVPSVTGSLVSVVLALMFILFVIFACAWFLRKFTGGGFATNKVIEVKANQPLGTKERLVIIKVDGRHLLLGVTPNSIQKIDELSEDCIPKVEAQKISFKDAFATQLKKSLGKHDE